MHKNNYISLMGYSISLFFFSGALICSLNEIKNISIILLFVGGVLLTITSLYIIVKNKL